METYGIHSTFARLDGWERAPEDYVSRSLAGIKRSHRVNGRTITVVILKPVVRVPALHAVPSTQSVDVKMSGQVQSYVPIAVLVLHACCIVYMYVCAVDSQPVCEPPFINCLVGVSLWTPLCGNATLLLLPSGICELCVYFYSAKEL